ncbi:hypothetical protein JTE90_000438 [Oedothorax gibbosus]|uniref:BTB domain-containing protein n=1 Tax=Oedothorax gibbosus TaxID=931172 RepID=A0AAV6UGR5_9ARAC|nr:hypothetical protein JTE90_000438 [Oedothorax gibbosus]
MASIGRRIRIFFGRIRAFVTNTDRQQDSIPFTVGDHNIELVGYRYIGNSLTESIKNGSSEGKSNVEASENTKDSPMPDKETEIDEEVLKRIGEQGDLDKIEIFHENMDWTIVDGMQDNIFPKHPVKKPGIDVKNDSTTSKRQTVAEFLLEKGCQVYPKSPKIESFQLLRHVSKGRFQKVKPDVLLEVGKDYKFQIHKEKFLLHARHFKECLIDEERTSESFWALKVDPQYADPRALYCIFHFLYENRPLTCRHFAGVITAANYLGMDRMITYLEMIVGSRIPIHINSMLQNCLLTFVLAFEMRSQFENSQVIAAHHSDNVHVTIKGQNSDLTEEDIVRLWDSEYIKLQSERSFVSLANSRGNAFEKVAVGPHIVFEAAESLTYWVFNVFKSNVEEAIFIDADIWKEGLERSLELSVEFLSLHYQELMLSNAYSQLNEAQLEYIPRQEIVADLKDIQPHMKVPEWKKMRYWTKNLKLESESDSE